MANLMITVTDAAGTIHYADVRVTRYNVSSMVRKTRTQVAMQLRVPADSLTAEGYEVGNAANSARVQGATWIEDTTAGE